MVFSFTVAAATLRLHWPICGAWSWQTDSSAGLAWGRCRAIASRRERSWQLRQRQLRLLMTVRAMTTAIVKTVMTEAMTTPMLRLWHLARLARRQAGGMVAMAVASVVPVLRAAALVGAEAA